MNPATFIHKWSKAELTEKSASQQHFLDLCDLVGHQKPASLDPTGDSFTFEKGAAKHGGGDGWADVWKKGYFGLGVQGQEEGSREGLRPVAEVPRGAGEPADPGGLRPRALRHPHQLHRHRHPHPRIHPRRTGRATESRDPALRLSQPRQAQAGCHQRAHHPRGRRRHRRRRPAPARPGPRPARRRPLPRPAGVLAVRRGHRAAARHAPDPAAREVCPRSRAFHQFHPPVVSSHGRRRRLRHQHHPPLQRQPVRARPDPRPHSRGHRGPVPRRQTRLGRRRPVHLRHPLRAWPGPRQTRPARRPLHLARRHRNPGRTGGHATPSAQVGRHPPDHRQPPHMGKEDPAQERRGGACPRPRCRSRDRFRRRGGSCARPPHRPQTQESLREANTILRRFLEDLAHIKILDPACGSGNFLYVTLQKLKDLEKEAIVFGMDRGLAAHIPLVGPWQLYGIESNPYAHELAQMTVWIGYLQWIKANGFGEPDTPVLRRMDNFECRDAILDLNDPENPKEPEWPEVDYIVSNPPFLGNRLMKGELGDDYVEALAGIYQKRLGGRPDLCCYWFEKAREHLVDHQVERVGLLATQGIRGGTNRKSLKAVKESGEIFFAESDRPWILDGANVHVSMVGFDDGTEPSTVLDGHEVETINSNLTTGPDVTEAEKLGVNKGIAFQGAIRWGPFDIDENEALELLHKGGNPHGRPNSDVIVPFVNGKVLTGQSLPRWIIDFGVDADREASAKYQSPFEIVDERVRPEREGARQAKARSEWWVHWNARPAMRAALTGVDRYFAITRHSKHALFRWMREPQYPDSALIVLARSDDYSFGILHSRPHDVWARAQGTQVRERESGFRYTPTTCFETFPFPDATPKDGKTSQEEAIAAAARELNDLREEWLNPKDWTREEILEFPGSTDGPWAKYLHDPDSSGIGTVRYPRTVPREPIANPDDPDNPETDYAAKLAARTLTKLYNQRPTWLDLAHQKLDQAVFEAYGWDPDLTDEELLEKLLALNLNRSELD